MIGYRKHIEIPCTNIRLSEYPYIFSEWFIFFPESIEIRPKPFSTLPYNSVFIISMQTMPTQGIFYWFSLGWSTTWPRNDINTHMHKRPEHTADKPFPFSSPSPSVPNIPEFLAQSRMDSNNLSNLLSERLVPSSLL